MSYMPITSLIRPLALSALSASALFFASCASGPSYSEVSKTLPPVANGKERVFIYRATSFGAAIKPAVKIDGQVVGKSRGQGFIYSDQKPGTHDISIRTEYNHKNTIQVKPGQPTFVRCHVTPGLLAAHVLPNQVDAATGEEEIQDCKLASE